MPVDVGPRCRTATPAPARPRRARASSGARRRTGSCPSRAPTPETVLTLEEVRRSHYVQASGGLLTGTLDVPPLVGCLGPAGDLSTLISSAVSGAGPARPGTSVDDVHLLPAGPGDRLPDPRGVRLPDDGPRRRGRRGTTEPGPATAAARGAGPGSARPAGRRRSALSPRALRRVRIRAWTVWVCRWLRRAISLTGSPVSSHSSSSSAMSTRRGGDMASNAARCLAARRSRR